MKKLLQITSEIYSQSHALDSKKYIDGVFKFGLDTNLLKNLIFKDEIIKTESIDLINIS